MSRDLAVNADRPEQLLDARQEVGRRRGRTHLVIAYPPFAVEVAPDECGPLLPGKREDEVGYQPHTAPVHPGTEHPAQKPTQRERVVRELVIPVRARNDPRRHAEGLLELLRIDLEVGPVLVRDAQPVAREAAVGNDVAQNLIEGHTLIDAEPAGVLEAIESAPDPEQRRELLEDRGTQGIAE